MAKHKTKLAIKYPILGSSQDVTKISLTIKGVVGLLVTILVGFGFSQVDLDLLATDIVQAVELSVQLFFLGVSIWGALRKFKK